MYHCAMKKPAYVNMSKVFGSGGTVSWETEFSCYKFLVTTK